MAPVGNLAQSAQTLVGRREDVSILLVFSAQLVTFFSLLALMLFHTPLRDTILRGLTPELASYAEPALVISFVMAAFWGCTALFRGLLAKALKTGSLADSGVLRIVTAAVISSIALANPDINGATLGIAAMDPLLCSRVGRKHMASAEAGVVRGEVKCKPSIGRVATWDGAAQRGPTIHIQRSTRDGRTLVSWVRSCPDPKVRRTEARCPIRRLLAILPLRGRP